MTKVIIPHDELVEGGLSISQINQLFRCRRAWKYGYVDKLAKKYERPYFTKGKLAHVGMCKAMEMKYHNPEATIDSMINHGETEIYMEYCDYIVGLKLGDPELWDDETLAMLDGLEKTYEESKIIFRRALKDFQPDKWEIITVQGYPAIELHYVLPIRGTRLMHGFIDLVAREKETGQIWQIDWKFKSQLSPEEDEVFNIQNAVYTRALKRAGVEITGSLTFQALNIGPTVPNINKNGSISRAKIRISWEDYAQFCSDNGENPANYQEEMEPKLADIIWTRPTREYRSDFMMENIWKNIVQAASYEIAAKNKKDRWYLPAIYPMNCKSCAYMPICQGELRGYDLDFIVNSEYVSKLDISLEEEEVE